MQELGNYARVIAYVLMSLLLLYVGMLSPKMRWALRFLALWFFIVGITLLLDTVHVEFAAALRLYVWTPLIWVNIFIIGRVLWLTGKDPFHNK